jgi:hypothetical protein
MKGFWFIMFIMCLRMLDSKQYDDDAAAAAADDDDDTCKKQVSA